MKVGTKNQTETQDKRSSGETPFRLGDWLVEPAPNRMHRGNEAVRLEPKVMQVLTFLVERRGRVVSRRELEAKVWPSMIVTDDAVTNTVIKLRRALGDEARNPRYIETIAKSGYRLIADVDMAVAAPPGSEPAEHTLEPTPDDGPTSIASPATQPSGRRGIRPVAALLGAVVFVALVIAWLVSRSPDIVRERVTTPLPGRPVVAVLPFENLSGDPEQDYFADGITQDLITDLSKLSGMQVVARNSVLAYDGTTEPEIAIGRELGAGFIVTGSVQRADRRLRINVNLTDAVGGRNRWGERYDRQLADIFRVQDQIVSHVVSALQVELAPGELQRLTGQYATSVEAYDELLRGLDLLGRRAIADNPEAKAHFERAIELDPRFARAYAGLALTYAQHAVFGAGKAVDLSLVKAEEVARQGLAIDDSLPQLHYALGLVEMYQGNLAVAIADVSHAIELRPSYADGYGLLAWILHFAGRPHEGLDAMQQAIDLNPQVPALYRTVKGALHYELGQLEQALRLLEDAVEISPDQLLARLYLAAVYAASGQMDAAAWQVEEIRALDPEFELDLDHRFPIRDPQYRERFLNDLARAGLTGQ